MKTRHLPVRHLATPLLLSLLAACGGGGANPSANLVSAPVNGTQAGGGRQRFEARGGSRHERHGQRRKRPGRWPSARQQQSGRQRQPAGRRHVGQPRRLF